MKLLFKECACLQGLLLYYSEVKRKKEKISNHYHKEMGPGNIYEVLEHRL